MTQPFRTAPMKDGIRYDSRGEPIRPMSEPFRNALAAALDWPDCGYLPETADEIIAALPPEWRDYLAARVPLLALVAAADKLNAFATWSALNRPETRPFLDALADPAIAKLREAGRG